LDDSHITKAQLVIRPNAPVELGIGEETQFTGSIEERQKLRRISSALNAYRASVKELLAGRYAALKEAAPVHMTDACCMMAFVFSDGILIRYDFKTRPDQKGFIGVLDGGTLASMTPQLSGSFVHCPDVCEGYDPGNQVVTLTLSACAIGTSDNRIISNSRLYVVARRKAAVEASSLPLGPGSHNGPRTFSKAV
jgi:hypothetical protein